MDDTAAVQPSLADFETRTFGDVTLVRGDCLDVMTLLLPRSVAMCFADLPYAGKKRRHTYCPWDNVFPLAEFWDRLSNPLKDDATTVCTASQPFTTVLISSKMTAFKYCLVWNKKFSGSFATAKSMPLRVHEDIVVFANGRTVYNAQKTLREKAIKLGSNKCLSKSSIAKTRQTFDGHVYTDKHPISILEFSNRVDKRGLHPTQKPVALLEWLIRTYTNDGDTILDPVSGSATTAVAAMNVGNRKVICIEKDPTYFEIMTKRVADHQKALANAQA